MKLSALLKNLKYKCIGNADVEITGLCYDSRAVEKGDLFFCIKGYAVDGHKFAHAAADAGAACLVVSEKQDVDAVQIVVDDTREAMALISANYYGNPADKLTMIGVTGTNGKTTTTYMLKKILETAGRRVGLIGTIECIIGNKRMHSERTTPESMDLQRMLSEMLEVGCDSVVMEVSSHSLYLKRVFGIKFSGAIFTNLTQDHLDFHKDMDDYADAKAILFDNASVCAINADDSYSQKMLAHAKQTAVTFGIKNKAKYMARDINLNHDGSRFVLAADEFRIPILIGIPGGFSVYNALGAIALCLAMGIDLINVKKGIEAVENVPGRFQSLNAHSKGFSIILDYSHTPDSLETALKTVREFAKGRVICVFGCGGNRDRKKRPIMGEISGRLADFSIVTSDNPRFEQPCDIIDEILVGIKPTGAEYVTIENRREAIKYALQYAKEGDVILLAGKGHEDYQEICGVKHPFDEKVIVEELLRELYPNDK